MAEENARPTRGRKKNAATGSAGSAAKKNPAAKKAAAKTTVKKASAKTTTRTRRPAVVAEPTREAIAQQAYLLWERGEPGGDWAHWLRAEAALRAA